MTQISLTSIASIAGLWVLLFWLYREYRIDKFRSDVFALRDSFFDASAAGLIDFKHPAYGLLRGLMNGFIRSAHRLSLLQMLVLHVFVRTPPVVPFKDRWNEAVSPLTAETRGEIEAYRKKLNLMAIEHLVLISPVLVETVVLPVGCAFLAGEYISGLMKALRRPIEELDMMAASATGGFYFWPENNPSILLSNGGLDGV
jgi:hypothetical protein